MPSLPCDFVTKTHSSGNDPRYRPFASGGHGGYVNVDVNRKVEATFNRSVHAQLQVEIGHYTTIVPDRATGKDD